MLLVSLVLVNVVIAVLLDAFGKASSEEPSPVTVEQDWGEDEGAHYDKCPFGESTPGHSLLLFYAISKGDTLTDSTKNHYRIVSEIHRLRPKERLMIFGMTVFKHLKIITVNLLINKLF